MIIVAKSLGWSVINKLRAAEGAKGCMDWRSWEGYRGTRFTTAMKDVATEMKD